MISAALVLFASMGLQQGTIAAAPVPTEPDTGTYYLLRGEVVIARERYARSDTLLDAELVFADQPRLKVRATIGPDASITRIELRVFPPDAADTTLIQSSAAVLDGRTIRLEQPIGTPVGDPITVPAGTLPYLNPSPSFMEQIVRRARTLGDDSTSVDVWIPGVGGGRVVPVDVLLARDGRATLAFPDGRIELALTADRRLIGASIPGEDLRIHRVRAPE